MPGRELPAGDYRPLRDYVRRRGGLRVAMHGRVADQVLDEIVAGWPIGCPVERMEEVIRARVAVRLKKRYGSIVAMLLLGALVNVLVRLIMDWWLEKRSHRVLMDGWAYAAKSADL